MKEEEHGKSVDNHLEFFPNQDKKKKTECPGLVGEVTYPPV
jgi:hypothetical protein